MMHRGKIVVVRGGDVLNKLIAVHEKLARSKSVTYAPWDIIGSHLIKHAKDDYWRGYLVQTFLKLGIDLSRYIGDKTRIPDAPPLDHKRVSLGLREFELPNGNRIELKTVMDDPDRFWADVMNDRRVPMALFLKQLATREGLKEDGRI